MNLNEIFNVIESSELIRSQHYYNRYKKMTTHYVSLNLKKDPGRKGEIESHHILPVAIWPEFKTQYSNTVNVPVRIHLILHYLLYKGLNHFSCAFSFNQMSRIGKLHSATYKTHRIEMAKLISFMNTGRTHTESQRLIMSEIHKGTNVYRNTETGELRRFKVGEQPDNWIPFQTNRVRTTESKKKLGDLMRGRIWQHNTDTKEVKFDYKLHQGFEIGYPKWLVDGRQHQVENFKWAYHPGTGDVIRSLPENIPDNYILGRNYDNKGFQKINNSNLQKVLDVVECRYVLVDKEVIAHHKDRYIKHGTKIDDILVFKYNGKTAYSWDELQSLFKYLPNIAARKNKEEILSHVISSPHHNQNPEKYEFCSMFQGKTLKEIGLVITRLIDKEHK